MGEQNPHIPRFIKDAPWYATSEGTANSGDYLAHHRSGKETQSNAEPRIGTGIKDEFIRDDATVKSSFKRRVKKAKCTNCGAMDHTKKDCIEKPQRKRVNIFGGDNVGKGKRNENLDYDGKRDRWYGYDTNEYDDYVKKWEEKQRDEVVGDRDFDTDEEIELRELGLWEDGLKRDLFQSGSGEKIVRLREDKAVYLKDLENETITYDPKSRMVRDDTTGYKDGDDMFVKHLTGEAKEFEAAKKFAWDDKTRGLGGNNFVANPTLADRKIKAQTMAELAKKSALRSKLVGVYGDVTESTQNTEGDDVMRSQYAEDVYLNNHTSVWGSYYLDGKWGYRCCKSTDRDSLCK
jgi:pre-mRNA-processing factor SLU7